MKKYPFNLLHAHLQLLIPLLVYLNSNAHTNATEGKMPVVNLISAVDVIEKINSELARSSSVEMIFEPNGASMSHCHPGPVSGYVLEGTYEFKIEGKPLRTLVPGDTFCEPLMALQEVGRNPSDKAKTKVLAIVVHPRSANQLVIPEKYYCKPLNPL